MNKTETQAQQTAANEKADWLVALEQQSWQAELLVSSIAIFGTLQLPGLIMSLIDFMLIYLPRDMMGWLPFFICFYLIMASVGLAILFIYHFVARSFWIGLVGLISAYPEGIKFSNSRFSDYIVSRLEHHYPDLDAYNQNLDHRCSTIFASSFLFASSLLGTAIIIVVLLLTCYFLAQVLPYDAQTISVVIGLSLLAFFMLGSFLNAKPLRDIHWLKRPHYLMLAASSLLMYTVFWRSAGYIALTFRTHQDTKTSMALQLIIMTLVTAVAFPIIEHSNIDLFDEDKYARIRADANTLYQDAYEDERVEGYVLYPTIPSYEIQSRQLKVFIPELKREQSVLDSLLPPKELDPDLSRREETTAHINHFLKQTAQFHSIFVNGTEVEGIDYYYQRNKNKSQTGVVALIDGKYLADGKNQLKIEKAYENSEGEPMQIYLNFFYAPDTN